MFIHRYVIIIINILMVSKADIVQMAYNLFDSYDSDKSGFLDIKEFKIVMKQVFG